MKNYKNYIYLIITALFFSSCNDAIDIEQPGLLIADNAIQNVDDLELNLNAIYGFLDNTNEIRFNALYTDEIAKGIENGGQGNSGFELNLNSNSLFPYNLVRANAVDDTNSSNDTGTSRRGYQPILSHINRLLEIIPLIEPQNNELTRYNNLYGELLALRAYCHFTMVTYLSTDLTDNNALGCILLDRVPGLVEDLPRSTNGEIYAFIENDLSTAFNLLPSTSSEFKINKDFVTALRARMYAYRGMYSTALPYAEDLLARYPIANRTTYPQIFTDSDPSECIFKLDRTIGDNWDNQGTSGGGWVGSLFAFIDSSYGGGPYMEMSRSLFAKYNISDVRYNTFIGSDSTIDPNYANDPNFLNTDVILIKKYPGSGGQPLLNDLKIFRSSEMLFIKAEALADAGLYNDVATTLKELVDARYGTPQPILSLNNEQEAFGAILDERRKELAFEGHRWIDLKRLGVRGNRSIDRDATECALTGACTLSQNDYRFTVPYPVEETDINELIVQNPNY